MSSEGSFDERYARDPLWERTREFDRLVNLVLADPEAALPASLTPGQVMSVEAAAAAARSNGNFTHGDFFDAFKKAWRDTGRHINAPRSSKPTRDVARAWMQPEGRALWSRIIASSEALHRTVPALQSTLGVMLATAGMRATPHVLHGWDSLRNNLVFRDLVEHLAESCEGSCRQAPVPTSYSTATRHLPRLSVALSAEVHVTLAEITAELIGLGIPAGKFLAVDGSLVPAWVSQSPRGNDSATHGDVGRRVYKRKYNGVSQTTRAMTGYNLTALVDLATGVVQAFALGNAQKTHEPRVLRDELLPKLFHVSPDLEVRAIVGDNMFDNNETHEHLLTRYGINLVAKRYRHQFAEHNKSFKPDARKKDERHPSIASIRGDGVAVCRAHGILLSYRGLDAPRTRQGLEPGDLVDPDGYRTRFICPSGCGVTSIRTSVCWGNVPYYPHTPHGRYKLYAYRRALLYHRNQIESVFSALQCGYKQGLDGAARVRVVNRAVNEALIALSIVTRALLLLADARDDPVP